jgi:hypothetical protein
VKLAQQAQPAFKVKLAQQALKDQQAQQALKVFKV